MNLEIWCVLCVQEITLTEGSKVFATWKNPPPPVFMQFFFFNVTNPDAFLKGEAKPHLTEMGPYTFRYITRTVNAGIRRFGFHDIMKSEFCSNQPTYLTGHFRSSHCWLFLLHCTGKLRPQQSLIGPKSHFTQLHNKCYVMFLSYKT